MGGWGVKVGRVGSRVRCRSVVGLVCCRFVCGRRPVRVGGSVPSLRWPCPCARMSRVTSLFPVAYVCTSLAQGACAAA
jgi:hypothetical protein